MSTYLEITLLPNAEISTNFLWSKVFQQIHLGLVEMQDEQKQVPIGISFPNYEISEKNISLGEKLRLFADSESTLVQFNSKYWLSRLSDYVHCTSIRPVPEKNITGYASYQREQPQNNKERLARRYATRHQISYEQALKRYSSMKPKITAAPFIQLKSLSTNQPFRLWIKKMTVSGLMNRKFSTYGLSPRSSVPEF